MTTTLTTTQPATAELYRQATDVAGVCRDIVLKTVQNIQGKQYVKVEGWQSIATAHGCVASARDVMRTDTGFRAIGEIRRMDTGAVIATAEGFVGDDEKTWANRAEYAKRAMAQTRAISRACRSAFAHVVVLMDAGLSTTPAEEVPEGGFNDRPATTPAKFTGTSGRAQMVSSGGTRNVTPPRQAPAPQSGWRAVQIHFGKKQGVTLGELERTNQIGWWLTEWQPKEYKGSISPENIALRAALDEAMSEMESEPPREAQTTAEQEANMDGPPADDVNF